MWWFYNVNYTHKTCWKALYTIVNMQHLENAGLKLGHVMGQGVEIIEAIK